MSCKEGIESLKNYQDSGFYLINLYLRECIPDEEFIEKYKLNETKLLQIKEHIKNIDNEFIEKSEKTVDDKFVVYRGVRSKNCIYDGKNKGYVSTSRYLSIGQKYAAKEGCVYELRLDKDIPYIDLSIYWSNESEILLPYGLIYTIEKQYKVKKNTYVVLKVTKE